MYVSSAWKKLVFGDDRVIMGCSDHRKRLKLTVYRIIFVHRTKHVALSIGVTLKINHDHGVRRLVVCAFTREGDVVLTYAVNRNMYRCIFRQGDGYTMCEQFHIYIGTDKMYMGYSFWSTKHQSFMDWVQQFFWPRFGYDYWLIGYRIHSKLRKPLVSPTVLFQPISLYSHVKWDKFYDYELSDTYLKISPDGNILRFAQSKDKSWSKGFVDIFSPVNER
jgi:hypothetical protein